MYYNQRFQFKLAYIIHVFKCSRQVTSQLALPKGVKGWTPFWTKPKGIQPMRVAHVAWRQQCTEVQRVPL